MTHVTLHIENKKKWAAIKTVLEAMDITYNIQEKAKTMSEQELALLRNSEADVAEERIYSYKSHRDILGK